MPTTLQDRRVAAALDRMYAETREQVQILRNKHEELERLSSASAQERADALSAFYIPVTREAGRLLYSLVRATRPTRPYLYYVRDAENGYVSVNFLARESDSMEISCRV
jgi:hypothetical protein